MAKFQVQYPGGKELFDRVTRLRIVGNENGLSLIRNHSELIADTAELHLAAELLPLFAEIRLGIQEVEMPADAVGVLHGKPAFSNDGLRALGGFAVDARRLGWLFRFTDDYLTGGSAGRGRKSAFPV